MRCVLLGSSPVKDVKFIKAAISLNDFVICVDGGFYLSEKLKVKPNILIGDNDSFLNKFDFIKDVVYKKEKNDTDMIFAIKYALKMGYSDFLIFGATNARLDHMYANFCCLEFLSEKKNIKAKILDENNEIFILKKETKEFKKTEKKYISFFPFGCASCTITASDLKYPLFKTNLSSNFPLGVSNEMLENKTKVTVERGKAIVFLSSDPKVTF